MENMTALNGEVVRALLDKEVGKNPDIENRFMHHPPFGTQLERYWILRSAAKDFAYRIEQLCPNSREKSLALTNLEQAMMWANASIARNEKEPKDEQ